jgi:ubiquinone/menaquinone biosynthesis C-methylase UbiE
MLALIFAAALAAPARDVAQDHGARSSAATTDVGRDGSAHPIDCPLHKGGVDPRGMRPFAETEKWIEYLESPERASWQRPDEVVKALALKGTETVADVGAGSGYFTFRIANALPRGKVYATDVDPEMVRHLHRKVMTEHISNIEVALAQPNDPGIPPGTDVAFVCDVIHHVAERDAWLRRGFEELQPGGKLVVIEFKEGRLPQGPPEAVKIPKSKLIGMIEAAGFRLAADDPKLLPYQTFLTFEKPARTAGASVRNPGAKADAERR